MKRKLVALAVLLVGLAGFWALLGGEEGASVFLSQPMPGPLAGRVIGVDAGHGGYDGGCTGANGTAEKDLNLAVALLLRDELEARGATVVLSREEDVALIDPENTPGYKKRKELTRRLEIFAAAQAECVAIKETEVERLRRSSFRRGPRRANSWPGRCRAPCGSWTRTTAARQTPGTTTS